MKERHKEGNRLDAQATLKLLNISVGQDFYTLRLVQVEGLIKEADRVRYQASRTAKKSRANSFFDHLQRRAK